jgi:hypothetical protein
MYKVTYIVQTMTQHRGVPASKFGRLSFDPVQLKDSSGLQLFAGYLIEEVKGEKKRKG